MDLISQSARAIRDLLAKGEITGGDVLDALEARIAEVDPAVNALPTLCFDRARDRMKALEAKLASERGLLGGVPVAIKDLSDVSGVRSTNGSPIFADHIPEASAHVVERIESEGGIVYAKSNTPEFGAGGNTFNEVFGATLNPWNTALSAAGSSGGSAAALASGMAWLASGSDMGGSLRNPASFCGIVGMRPSPGRVPGGLGADPYSPLGVEGPMARDVDDLAMLFDAMCGDDPREPISLPRPETSFAEAAARRSRPRRVAYSPDLGVTPVDPEVAGLCETAARQFESMGVSVEFACPDFSEAHEVFQVLRAHSFATGLSGLLDTDRDKLKPEVIWNIEKGLALTSADIGRAERARGVMVARAAAFFETYDLLLCPATIVPPFPVENRYVERCNGVEFETYIDWLAIVYAITNVSLPALSLPCGFTKCGLPVGLQMIGAPRGEASLLSAAGVLEDALALEHLPIDPRHREKHEMAKAKPGTIRVGIGGWTYAPWRGVFYPDKHPQKRELEYAGAHLTAIEVNGTFYGSQKPETFAKWHDETPDGFVFSLKASRYATNRKVLAEAGESVERFVTGGMMELKDKLGPINWQFRATKKFEPDDFEAFLKLLPSSYEGRALRHVVEVRHESFCVPEFVDMARAYGVAVVVSVDAEFPQIADPTAPFVYARIMGSAEDEPLGYSEAALDLWAKRAKSWTSGQSVPGLDCVGPGKADGVPRDVYLFFISGHKISNPAAAMALIERVG